MRSASQQQRFAKASNISGEQHNTALGHRPRVLMILAQWKMNVAYWRIHS